MRIRCIIWALVALISVIVFQNALGDSDQNASVDNSSLNNALTPTAELTNVEGIWKVILADTEITFGLNQSGNFISGRCKFEGDAPWNGAVAGSISGTMINMAVSSLKDKLLAATQITGTISNDPLHGSHVSYDSDGKMTQGEVAGTRISPDVTGYVPAEVKEAPATTVVQQPQTIQQNQTTIVQQTQANTRKVQRIEDLAKGIDPNILPRSYPL